MDLVIKNLSKNYKKKEAVKNVDVTLSPGMPQLPHFLPDQESKC